MKRILSVPQDIRTFRLSGSSPHSSLLARSGSYFPRGTKVEVAELVTMIYDHRDKLALEVQAEGVDTDGPLYILAEEIDDHARPIGFAWTDAHERGEAGQHEAEVLRLQMAAIVNKYSRPKLKVASAR